MQKLSPARGSHWERRGQSTTKPKNLYLVRPLSLRRIPARAALMFLNVISGAAASPTQGVCFIVLFTKTGRTLRHF